jgi:putative hydrolase of the HAD superfamily
VTVRAILFDIGDTLFRLNPIGEVREELAEVLAEGCGVNRETALEVADKALTSHREQAIAAWRSGRTEEPALDQVLLQHFSPHAEIDRGTAAALAEVLWRADVARFEPAADCASRVERFRNDGFRLAAVSNTSTHASYLDNYLESIGLLPLFETIVYSSELGVRKPHPQIYQEALRRLAIEPSDAIFVGDRVREDVLGPMSVGVSAVLTHEYRQEDQGEAQPLAVINTLSELASVVQRPV